MKRFEDGKKIWDALSKREARRRQDISMLEDFIREIAPKRKTPMHLLKLAVYTGGIRASDAAQILGIKRRGLDLFVRYMSKKGLLEVESLKHPNPTIKPAQSIALKIRKAEKIKRLQKKEEKPQSDDIDDIIDDMTFDDPLCQKGETEIEKQLAGLDGAPACYSALNPSSTYVIVERSGKKSEKLLISCIGKGMDALYITRSNPKTLKEDQRFKGCDFIWLTSVQSKDGVNSVGGVQDLSILVGNRLEKYPKSIILLDGLEYLISNNNFPLVLKLIQQLRDKVSTTDSILIMPLDPDTLDERQMALICVECEVLN